jgi:hypothetical protein
MLYAAAFGNSSGHGIQPFLGVITSDFWAVFFRAAESL